MLEWLEDFVFNFFNPFHLHTDCTLFSRSISTSYNLGSDQSWSRENGIISRYVSIAEGFVIECRDHFALVIRPRKNDEKSETLNCTSNISKLGKETVCARDSHASSWVSESRKTSLIRKKGCNACVNSQYWNICARDFPIIHASFKNFIFLTRENHTKQAKI